MQVASDPRVRFVDQLKQLRIRAGGPTLDELEKQNPEWLKHSAVSELLAGKGVRLPRWERVAAFVTACMRIGNSRKRKMLPEQDLLEQWRRQHDALAVALDHTPSRGRSASTEDSDSGAGTNVNTATPEVGTGRRRFGAVPPRAGAFQHRAVAEVLVEAVGGGGITVLTGTGTTPASVLIGLGGVGKTQLAVDHAYTQWDSGRVDVLVWISARTRDAITSAYIEAAVGLLGQDPTFPERAWRRLLDWLAETDTRWLVVLDDLQAPGDLSGLWPPHTPAGQVVVTTRCRDAALHGHQRRIVDVGLFTPAEAVAYLTEKLPDRTHTDIATTDLAGLAHALGYLPLALAQAAAYLTNNLLLTTTGYRSKLADRRIKLRDVVPREGHLPDEYEQTVAATWSLSIEAADQLDPTGLARPILELTSLLDPAGIPIAVFATDATTNHLTARLDHDITADDVLGGLECLRRFSLITLDPDQPHRTVRVHALVQRAVRDTLSAYTLDALAQATADAVLQAWPTIDIDPDLTQAMRSNTSALQDTAEEHLWPGGHLVLLRHARSLGEAGLLGSAITVLDQLHHQALTRLGPDHLVTFTTRHNLAYWRGRAGNAAVAVTAFEELLADQLRVLGPDHPDILSTRSNIAGWRGQAGDPAGAVTAFEELLTDLLRALGPDHPNTLSTRSNIAANRGAAGDPAGAVTAFKEVLTDQLRILGPNHPNTLSTRTYIAHWRGEAGDPAGAVAAFKGLLADLLRVLGPDHPDFLKSRANIAGYRGEAGDPAGAIAAFEELLTDQLRILGPNHLDTLDTRGNIARWRGKAGDPAGAVAAFEELLANQLRILDPFHPDTLDTRRNIAHWRGHAGDPADAVAAFKELLADLLEVLGPDHLYTLSTRSDVATWRGAAGDPAAAATETAQLLTDLLRVLGPDHPHILATRRNLAFWRRVEDEADRVDVSSEGRKPGSGMPWSM